MVPHDPAWAAAFGRAAAEVRHAMAANLIDVHHIGSTAIPGIYAKPVIDMLAVVKDITRVGACNAELIAVGYQAMGEFGLRGRRYFRRDNAAGTRTIRFIHFRSAHRPLPAIWRFATTCGLTRPLPSDIRNSSGIWPHVTLTTWKRTWTAKMDSSSNTKPKQSAGPRP